MKLQDLATPQQSKQTARVFESFFGQNIGFNNLSRKQTRNMLNRVRSLMHEHRRQPNFHNSEHNPAYLKLVVLEQGLTARMRETDIKMDEADSPALQKDVAVPGQSQTSQNATAAGVRKIASATGQTNQAAVLGKAIDTAVAGQTLNPAQRSALATQMGGLQKALADPVMAQRLQQTLKTAATAESKKTGSRRLREASEVQQAQVVLAAQDMVDKMQKMLEEVSAMQFKDLPALVDSIKNEVGQQQANQFNADATAALTGLMQNLQAGKQQMDAALGVVTGEAAAPVAAADLGAAADMTGAVDDLEAMDAELGAAADDEAEELAGAAPDLGRGRR